MNTKFFHLKTKVKRSRNKTIYVSFNDNNLNWDELQIKNHFVSYFHDLFQDRSNNNIGFDFWNFIQPKLTKEDNLMFLGPLSGKEIEVAVEQLVLGNLLVLMVLVMVSIKTTGK